MTASLSAHCDLRSTFDVGIPGGSRKQAVNSEWREKAFGGKLRLSATAAAPSPWLARAVVMHAEHPSAAAAAVALASCAAPAAGGSSFLQPLPAAQAGASGTSPALQHLHKADYQQFLEVGTQLQYGDPAAMTSACSSLRELVWDFPASLLLATPSVRDGLLHALQQGQGSTGAASASLCALAAEVAHRLAERLLAENLCGGRREEGAQCGPLRHLVEETVSMLGAELLRSALRCSKAVPDALQAFIHFEAFLSTAGGQNDPLGGRPAALEATPSPGWLPSWSLHVQAASDVLYAALVRQEVTSLLQALNWFMVEGLVLPRQDHVWKEPLITHDWSLHSLSVYDALTELLMLTPSTEALQSVAASCTTFAVLVPALLMDYRLLCERPLSIRALHQCAVKIGCSAAQDFKLFCELSEAMQYGAEKSSTSQTPSSPPKCPEHLNLQQQLESRVGGLGQSCCMEEEDIPVALPRAALDCMGLVCTAAHGLNGATGIAGPATLLSTFWQTATGRRALAMLQIFRSLQHGLVAESPWRAICSATQPQAAHEILPLAPHSTAIPSSTALALVNQPLRPVWRKAVQQVVKSRSRADFTEGLARLLLLKPVGNLLLRENAYMTRLLLELAQLTSIDMTRAPAGAVADHCLPLLEHVVALTESFDVGGIEGTQIIADLAAALSVHVLPAVGRALSANPAIDEAALQAARGLLAANARLQLVLEAVLRVSVALLRSAGLSWARTLLDFDWRLLLAVSVSSSVAPARRLAMDVASHVLLGGAPGPGGMSTGKRQGTTSYRMVIAAIITRLEHTSLCPLSWSCSNELKVGLHIIAELAGTSELWTDEIMALSVEGCLKHCLAHLDPAIQLLAWRALHRARLRRSADTGAGIEDLAVFATAVQTLEAAGEPKAQDGCSSSQRASVDVSNSSTAARDPTGLEECLVFAEVFAFISSVFNTMFAKEADRRRSCFDRIMEIEILTSRPLRQCLNSRHGACQLASIRLLQSLLDVSLVVVKGVMLQEGMWPWLVDELQQTPAIPPSMPSRHSRNHPEEALALVAAFLELFSASVHDDAQLLVWLSTSTPILELWLSALDRLAPSLAAMSTKAGQMQPIVSAHLHALQCLVTTLKAEGLDGNVPLDVAAWSDVLHFLRSLVVWQLLSDSLRCCMPSQVTAVAVAIVTEVCTTSCSGIDLCVGDVTMEEMVGRRVYALLKRKIAVGSNTTEDERSTGAGAPLVQLEALCICLATLFQASSPAAIAVMEEGLLQDIASYVEVQVLPASGKAHGASQPPKRLILTLRVVSALLVATWCVRTAEVEASLTALLHALRNIAEKEDMVGLAMLNMLSDCLQADGTPQADSSSFAISAKPQPDTSVSSAAAVEETALHVGDASFNQFSAFLMKGEVVHWLMRLSFKRSVTTPVYCKIMEVLSLCSPVLSGKPLLRRYLSKVVETLRRSGRLASAGAKAMQDGTDESQRFAHGGDPEHAKACMLGIDFWLDLMNLKGSSSRSVRIASLRVLLAMALSDAPSARTYLSQSERTAKLLLQVACGPDGAAATLALSLLWALMSRTHRMVGILRRCHAGDQLGAVKVSEFDGDEEKRVSRLILQQINGMLAGSASVSVKKRADLCD